MNPLQTKREELAAARIDESNAKAYVGSWSSALEDCQKRIETLTREIAELEKSERWKPEEGTMYSYIDETGRQQATHWNNVMGHMLRFENFNVFPSRGHAEAQATRDRVRRKADWAYGAAQPYSPFGGESVWFIRNGEMDWSKGSTYVRQGLSYFSSADNATRFRELMGEDFEAWLKL